MACTINGSCFACNGNTRSIARANRNVENTESRAPPGPCAGSGGPVRCQECGCFPERRPTRPSRWRAAPCRSSAATRLSREYPIEKLLRDARLDLAPGAGCGQTGTRQLSGRTHSARFGVRTLPSETLKEKDTPTDGKTARTSANDAKFLRFISRYQCASALRASGCRSAKSLRRLRVMMCMPATLRGRLTIGSNRRKLPVRARPCRWTAPVCTAAPLVMAGKVSGGEIVCDAWNSRPALDAVRRERGG